MNILFAFANYSYPPKEGMHVQITLLLQQMQKLGHRCFVVTYVKNGFVLDVTRFQRECPGVELVGVFPTSSGYSALGVKNLLRNFVPASLFPGLHAFTACIRNAVVQHGVDVIHLEGIPLAPDLAQFKEVPVLFSTVDAWSLRQWRVMGRAPGLLRKLFRFAGYWFSRFLEQCYFPRAAAIHVVSGEDARYLQNLVPRANVVAIPVSMDARWAHVNLDSLPSMQAGSVLFSGDIRVDYIRDGLVWLLDAVWPQLPDPRLTLRVLGRAQPDPLLRQKALRCAAVEFVDWVEDFDAELAKAGVVVLPDQTGTGLKNRLIHALALARPVVSTSAVAEGIDVQSGTHLLVADTAKAFADAMHRFLSDTGFALRLGSAGRRAMLQTYAPAQVAALWDAQYRACCRRPT